VLPHAPRRGIVINLPELRLYYFPGAGEPLSFPIGIGGEGAETPAGRTVVTFKRAHPSWIPTASEHAEDPELPAAVRPGPDNPMGDFALYLGWRGYAIHGTNRPYSIGRRDSHGCIRMYPEDIAILFALVTPGTSVTVVDEPVKVGWQAGELYLEVHWDQADAESLETYGVPRAEIAADADDIVAKAAGADVDRLNWYTIHLAENRRDGVPVQITQPRSPY
jgi:L,D-transpeptidase ErfK/SrfK